MTDPDCDVRLPHRIPLRCMAALSSTGFELCTAFRPQLKPHRLKPVLLEPLVRYGAVLLGRLEFGVQLPDEPVRTPRYHGNFCIEIGCRMGGEHIFRRLALLDKFCHMIPDSQNHIPVGDHRRSSNSGAMTRDNLRIGPCQPDYESQPLKHSVE